MDRDRTISSAAFSATRGRCGNVSPLDAGLCVEGARRVREAVLGRRLVEHDDAARGRYFAQVGHDLIATARQFGGPFAHVFAFHGYSGEIHQLLLGRPAADRFHVRGYREEETTTTPFDMVVLNEMSRYHLGTRRSGGRSASG